MKSILFVGGLLASAVGSGIFWSPMFFEWTEKMEQDTALAGLLTMFVGVCVCLLAVFLEWRENRMFR